MGDQPAFDRAEQHAAGVDDVEQGVRHPVAGSGRIDDSAERGRLPRAGLRRQASSSGQSRILRCAASSISCASMSARVSAILNVGHSQTNSSGPAGGSGRPGLSSSAAALNAEIAALSTNLLTVQNGQSLSGSNAELPIAAPAMIARLNGLYQVQATGATSANVYRSPLIPSVNTNALTVDAATLALPAASGTSVAQGEFLNAATAREPVCVLGAAAALLLGIDKVFPGERIWVTRHRRQRQRQRRHVAVRGRHPQPRRAVPRRRLLRAGRVPVRPELPELRRPPHHGVRQGGRQPGQPVYNLLANQANLWVPKICATWAYAQRNAAGLG
jgi:hypothetical protein